MDQESETRKDRVQWPARAGRGDLSIISSLSGKEIIERIVDAPDPSALVRGMAHGDFYWILKRVGINDCVPILEQASEEQWQYLLDLELWERDRFDLKQAGIWLTQLRMAAPHRLAKWLLSKGQATAYYYFYRSIKVEIKQHDDPADFPDGFFTLDGTYYIRVMDPDQRPLIEEILRLLAGEDLVAYQSLLLGLAGVLPAEAEEQLYRMKGVRLAEHGFLPFEEAISIYSPLDPGILGTDELLPEPDIVQEEEVPGELVPVSPFTRIEEDHLLVRAMKGFRDPLLQDRIYLEFAGLCNQLLSADGGAINDLDVLVRTCRKAAGYLGLALERACSGDLRRAERILKKHSLVSLFRVGFGLVLRLKWDVTRWMEKAWFAKHGFGLSFWGDEWGETIGALLLEKPLFYSSDAEGMPYHDFRGLADYEKCRDIMHNVMALDYLFSRMEGRVSLPEWGEEVPPEVTFEHLLFAAWARNLMGLRASFEAISLEQAREVLSRLRGQENGAPSAKDRFEDVFVQDILRLGSIEDEDNANRLIKVLSALWRSFRAEYEEVAPEDLDQRFSRYLAIKPSSGADPG